MNVLEIKGLYKSFGKKNVLRGLDLAIPEHSVFGFVGRNGAGKTTAMKAVLGLLRVDEGEIFVCGEPVTFGQTATNKYIGYLPDVPAFYPYMTAREYLTLCGESHGIFGEELRARCDELLSLVGLSDDRSRIKGYSRGMKQRLGIAQALLARPKLLICDEPTSALDPIGRKQILDILLSVREETTVIFSTHILSDVERICTDVAIINNGKIEMQGPVGELRSADRGAGFLIELTDAEACPVVAEAFAEASLCEDGSLRLDGNDEKLFEALEFIKEKGYSIRKIERVESSLEALFMEVVEK